MEDNNNQHHNKNRDFHHNDNRNRNQNNGGFRHHNRFGNQGGFHNNQNRTERRFEDVTFKDKTDDQIVQILLDKQKKIGRNLFGSDIHPLYELIIRQNKRIKSLEEKLANKTNNDNLENNQ